MFVENLRLRLRYIFWPFLRLLLLFSSVATAVSLAILHWYPAVERPDEAATFFGAAAIAFALQFPLKSSLLLVRDNSPKRNGASMLLFMVASLTFGFAAGTIPRYIIAKLGHLQPLPNLAALPHYPEAPYYQAGQVLLDTAYRRAYPTTFEGGKSSYRTFELAVACPVANSLPSTTPGTAAVWVTFVYHDRIDTPNIKDEYWTAYQEFIRTKKLLFRRDFRRPCYYFERSPADEWLGQPENWTRTGIRPPYGKGITPVILRPVYTPFSARTARITPFLVWSQAIGISLFCLLSLFLPLEEVRKQQLLAAEPSLLNK